MRTTVPPRVSAFFRARSGAFKAVVGLVGPTTAIVSTLLALGLISPFGGEDAIAKSIENTQDADTSAVVIDVRVGAPADEGEPIAYTGRGVFDHETGYGHFWLDFTGTTGMRDASNVEAILRGPVAYFRPPPDAKSVLGDRPWVQFDLAEVADRLRKYEEIGAPDAATVNLSALANVDFPDPSNTLGFLRRSSDLQEVGEETVFGNHTTCYTGTLGKGRDKLRLRVWIDDDDLVRRVRVAGGPESLDFTIGFKRFGVKVDAGPPPDRNVTDVLDLL